MVWIDRFKLHANIARFHRSHVNGNNSHAKKDVGITRSNTNVSKKDLGDTGVGNSYVHVVKGNTPSGFKESDSSPAISLDDECLFSKDLSNSLLGRVKEFASLSNLMTILTNEGFVDITIHYMGKLWIDDGSKDGDPKTHDPSSCRGDNDVAEVPGTLFEEKGQINDKLDEESTGQKVNYSEDPFDIYPLFNKKKDTTETNKNLEHSLKYPPGFTPNADSDAFRMNVEDDRNNNCDYSQECNVEEENNGSKGNCVNTGSKTDVAESVCSGHFKKLEAPRSGGSILNLMEELVKVGQPMGYNMDGYVNNMTEIIESQGAAEVLSMDVVAWTVMAISVISISLDSSEDSVGTPVGRVILFGTIPTTIPDTTPVITLPATQTHTPVIPAETPIVAPTIPPSPDYTPASPDYSPASDSDDTLDTPPSPTHGTPFTEIAASTQRSPIIPYRRVMILSPGQPIPHGRPYRYHPNGPIHMMTARKRVGPFLVPQLAVGHPVDHSSSDYFSPDDSARDSSSDSSSEASSDFHSDASSDSSSGHSLSDHSSPDLPSTSAGPSRKRRRSPTTFVPALSPVSGALSPVRADLIPSPKRVKDSSYLADVEVDPREISLRDDAIVRVSDEPHLEQDIDPEIQAEIDECIAYADALRDRGIDARVVVEAVDRDETETGVRGPVEVRVERVTHPAMPEDIPEPAQEGAVEVTYETLGDLVQRFHDHTQAIPVHRIQAIEGVQREQGHRIVGVESAVTALTERVAELERDNRRLRGTVSVESQRVDRLQRGMSRMQRELRQMRRLRFYDRVRVGRLEACARKHMGYRP
ncbi:hypothetical protein Tco_0343577 [Tanacetum coccineum]